MKIGFAGIGRMGAAMAGRLLGLGHEVSVWNRTREKTRELAAAGAKVADTPADLVREAEMVLSIVTDAKAIDALYRGPNGYLAAPLAGKLLVEMSTVRPETTIALDAEVRSKGGALVECPVGGTIGPAREGKLLGFVGGTDADVARARSVLESLCRRVEHVGPIGSGARLKLAINLPLLVYWEVLGEALSLCAPLKVDPARLMDIFADTSGGPNVLKVRGAAIAKAMQGGEISPVTFDIDSVRKDLRTMLEEGAARGFDLPVTKRALECYDDASREGMGTVDGAMMPVCWARRAVK